MLEATQEHTHETRDTQRAVECVVEQVCVCGVWSLIVFPREGNRGVTSRPAERIDRTRRWLYTRAPTTPGKVVGGRRR